MTTVTAARAVHAGTPPSGNGVAGPHRWGVRPPVGTDDAGVGGDAVTEARGRLLRGAQDPVTRLLDLQAHLAGATEELAVAPGEPFEHGVLRRLSGVVRARVCLLDPSGVQTWPVPGEAPHHRTDLLVSGPPGSAVTFSSVSTRTTALPVVVAGSRAGWVVALSSRPDDDVDAAADDDDELALVRVAAQLVAVSLASRAAAPTSSSARQRELLQALLQGRPPVRWLLDLAAELGFTEGSPRRVVLLGSAATGPGPKAAAWRRLSRELAAQQLPHASVTRDDDVLVLVQADDEALRRALQLCPRELVLIGRPVHHLRDFTDSLRGAEFLRDHHTVQAAGRPATDPAGAVWWENLPLTAWMASAADPRERRRRAELQLAPLAEQPLLLDAVAAFLRHHQDVGAAASSIYLHPNSLRYRLGRAEALLEGSLRDPRIITELYAALVETDALDG